MPLSSSSSSSSSDDDILTCAIEFMIYDAIQNQLIPHMIQKQNQYNNNRKYYERIRKMNHDQLSKEYFAPLRRRFRKRQHVSQLSKPYTPPFAKNRLQIRSLQPDCVFRKIQIQRDDTTFDAYVVGKENAPGIVVLHEWWGVDNEVKSHAIKISQLLPGFKALIPDLYRGKVGLDVVEAENLMDGLDRQGALKDIEASVNWLKANGSEKVGVSGYYLGGTLAIASAVLVPGVDAVVGFYGIILPKLANLAHAKAPVQAHFGGLDDLAGFSYAKDARDLEEKLKASGVTSEVHIYPGNVHAFRSMYTEGIEGRKYMGMNDVNDHSVQLAWSRVQSWMATYLS